MAEEKSHPPTPHRLRKARREGKVLKSRMVTQVCVTAGMLAVAFLSLRFCWVRWCLLLEWHFSEGFVDPLATVGEVVVGGMIGVGSVLIAGVCVAILVEAAQVGLSFEWGILAPKAERIDLVRGVRRLGAGVRDCGPAIVRLGVYGVFVFFIVVQALHRLSTRDLFDRAGYLADALRLGVSLGGGALACLGIFAGWDYLTQRKRYYRDLSMSSDEIQREFKENEGDPYVRATRRSLHEEMSFGERVRRIRKARVVVVARGGADDAA